MSIRWAIGERFEVPNYDGDGNYLTRWRIIQTPWFALYLHRFDGPDPRTTLHDHPWSFVSIILRGGYVERRLDRVDRDFVDENHEVRRVNVVNALDAHAILRLTRTPTWSLLLVGRRRREWGYLERYEDIEADRSLVEHAAKDGVIQVDQSGWRWTRFDCHPHAVEFATAMARRGLTQ